ncbi:MAG TPA: hypothetical protein VGE95_04810 [Arthrobacter sp.]
MTFKPDEVPQAFRVVVQDAPTGAPAEEVVTGSPASCQTVLDVINARRAHAAVNEIFNWKDSIYPGGATLASYQDVNTAHRSFQRLSSALKTCTSFTATAPVGRFTAKITAVAEAGFGDESVQFRVTTPVPGSGVKSVQHTLVRLGPTTADFTMVDMDHSPEFPRRVIQLQVNQLATVATP